MKKVVFSFARAGSLTREQIGSKALNLLWLQKNGFRVPNGFCLTCDAYQDHIQQLQIDFSTIHGNLEIIRNRILEKPISSSILIDIKTCYQQLSNPVVAVRSSATAEDLPGHSFAGQYETYLNVESFADCLEAIKKCWASLWTERAYFYREKNGIAHTNVKMAVIVQEMVEADVAGVMFTADPLCGKTDRIVIEACRGLGEVLVSGKVTPDELIFSKKNTKPIWIMPADMNKTLSLNIRLGRRLAKTGKRIERLQGTPQDIEWAIAKKKIYYLQTRPVTTHPIEQTWEDRQVWTNLNTGEVAPDVVTPLDFSIISDAMMPLFNNLAWILSIKPGTHPLFGRVAGRLYFNVNLGISFYTKLPSFLMKPYEAHALFGGADQKQYDLRKIRFGPDDLPDLKASLWKIILRMPFSLALLYTRRYSKAKDLLEDLKQKNKYYGSISLESMPSSQLYQYVVEILERVISRLDLLYLIPGLVPAGIVVQLCNKWLHDRNQVISNTLLKAAGNMDDVQAGVVLVELAQLAQQDVVVKGIIESEQYWEDIKPQLKELNTGQNFIRAWDMFMDQHGHHCRSEIMLFNPRWSEKPDYVLQMLKGCLYEADQDTPGQRYERQVRDQNQVVEQTLKQLKNPIKRWILRKFVKRAQRGLVFRENVKSEIVRLLTIIRRMILAMEKQLLDSRILKQADDIFFLKHKELSSVITGELDFDVTSVIEQRRQEYEKYKAIESPQLIIGRFDPDSYVPMSVNTDVSVFSGMSACPGRVTGKARVILRSDENQRVLPGEILVAPFTDPGWTPYFVNAAGIVMDQGGLLSHGSIVAREFAIPAVVNVGPATKIIQTGQTIEVDADQGIVRILESGL